MLRRDKTERIVKEKTVGPLSLRDLQVGLMFAVKTNVSYQTLSA